MIRTLALLLALLLPTTATAQKVEPPTGAPNLEVFSAGDVTMNAAIAEAQRTLPLFLSTVLDANGLSQTGSLKVSFRTADDAGDEIIWVGNFRRLPDGRFEGRLNNQPFNLGPLQQGDLVTFPETAIQDWSWPTAQGLYGNYTTRVIAAQQGNDALWVQLSRSPLPPGWE